MYPAILKSAAHQMWIFQVVRFRIFLRVQKLSAVALFTTNLISHHAT